MNVGDDTAPCGVLTATVRPATAEEDGRPCSVRGVVWEEPGDGERRAAALLGLATPDDVITPPSVALQDAVGQIEEVELEFSHDVVFVGELADCNVALASLFYRSDLNWNSANKDKDVLTVRVTEVLTAGTGVPTTDVRHLHVEVISVNDAPVVHVPGMEPLYGSWLRVVVWSLAGLGGSVCATGHGCVATVSC